MSDLKLSQPWPHCSRRRFALGLGFGCFSLLRPYAAQASEIPAALESTEPPEGSPVHWTRRENRDWRWYERETLVDGVWELSGVTTPSHKETGKLYEGRSGYLHSEVVPVAVRLSVPNHDPQAKRDVFLETSPGTPSVLRKQRHGRPPSRWLRNQDIDQLRIWLPTLDIPEAGVVGMSYWTHLTRDHHFDPNQIEGLAEIDQARLHAAAHFGY
ncbi:MAG: hypothetical protein VX500_09070 [Planctomycetota bacterium]|nr:hypothetical protein [Planctomycetota bacterium]